MKLTEIFEEIFLTTFFNHFCNLNFYYFTVEDFTHKFQLHLN